LSLARVLDPYVHGPLDAELRYYRLHGIGGYRYRYGDADLARLENWSAGTTYCLFNNLTMGEDAARFLNLLEPQRAG
jgi:uncharacterized protein YecE (DUF72 family)